MHIVCYMTVHNYALCVGTLDAGGWMSYNFIFDTPPDFQVSHLKLEKFIVHAPRIAPTVSAIAFSPCIPASYTPP